MSYFCIMKKLYDNYSILHPNGDVMFLCSEKRFNWYVDRNLAKKITETSAQLTFTPAGYGANSDDRTGLLPRENICVVCGTNEELTYHHVVPHLYKSLMPEDCKKHNSYDVMPVCEKCHREYEKEVVVFKNILQETHLDPDFSQEEYILNQALKSIRTLENYGHLIPDEKKDNLEKNILIAEEKLDINRAEFETLILPSTAQMVLDIIGIQELVVLFRTHFLNVMEPKFMPEWFDIFDLSMYKISSYNN